MTGGNARHGRRNNGLYAAEYSVVGDVDPRVGEHLLDVLGNRGIAAYLQPAADQNPVTRFTTLPSRPTDRLYVDRTELSTALKFLDMVAGDADQAPPEPERDPADRAPGSNAPAARDGNEFEVAWASIVAGYHRGTADESPPWPASEDATGAAAPTSGSASTPTGTGGPADWPRWSGIKRDESPEPSLLDGLDEFGGQLPDDEEEDYEPPAPPPLPRFAGVTIFGAIAILVGFILIIVPDLLPFNTGGGAVVGGACIVVGAIALIGRLRPGNDDDPDDPDLGAIV